MALKRFYHTALIWKRLVHPNIVPLLGVATAPPRFVSDCMFGGNLKEYFGRNPSTDLVGLVGDPSTASGVARQPPSQLSDVAEGLKYLHSRNVLHRGLTGVCDHSSAHRTTV